VYRQEVSRGEDFFFKGGLAIKVQRAWSRRPICKPSIKGMPPPKPTTPQRPDARGKITPVVEAGERTMGKRLLLRASLIERVTPSPTHHPFLFSEPSYLPPYHYLSSHYIVSIPFSPPIPIHMASTAPFELAAELRGHDGSVRTLCILGEGESPAQLLSGGDDGTVKR
jgi:hypothetical protein